MKMGATEGFMKYQIQHLEEENKTLKEKLSEVTMIADDEKQSIEHILELEEENKKLKEEKEFFYKSAKQFREENENLKEKVETLELWLDNKEKLNEEYRNQIDKLRTDNIYEEGLYN